MRVIVCENYEEVSRKAAKLVASQLMLKPTSILGLYAGSTPVGMYNMLIDMYKNGDVSFKDVTTYNLDEYYPISPDDKQSYHYFMKENFFSKVDINLDNTHIPYGLANDPHSECEAYEDSITKCGGVDLQILGIGQNGHIGLNESDANLNSATHLTDLTQSTLDANSRFFDNAEQMPKQAITMGIATILKAKRIVLLASGASRHRVVSSLLSEGINADIPASMLKLHSDVILICDKAAYSSDRLGIDIGGTDVKFGVIDENNNLVYKDSIPTVTESESALIDSLSNKCNEILGKYHVNSIGIGTPGIIRNKHVTAGNLPFKNTNLEKLMAERLSLPVSVSNDANCAALGEARCGAGKDVKNLVMVTLGTGIGGGIIFKNKIYQGKGSAGEIGHICIQKDGLDCPCGNKGCWEQYASVTALIKQAKAAAAENTDSILNEKYIKNGKLNGKLIFEAVNEGCPVAAKVLDNYLDFVAVGLKSIEYVFDPDMIVLSGGITNGADVFMDKLTAKLGSDVIIKISDLKNDAGITGAAML